MLPHDSLLAKVDLDRLIQDQHSPMILLQTFPQLQRLLLPRSELLLAVLVELLGEWSDLETVNGFLQFKSSLPCNNVLPPLASIYYPQRSSVSGNLIQFLSPVRNRRIEFNG